MIPPVPPVRPDLPAARALLGLVLLVVSLLIAAVVSSVVAQVLPESWPFGWRYIGSTAVLAVVLFAGQVWVIRELHRPGSSS